MMPGLSWLDHSDSDRQRAVELIKLFEEKGTVDELGIGTVRDAIADILFPGTSVLHPRARYFLIVPWIYRQLESKRIGSAEIAAKARQTELSLIDLILNSDDSQGAIGRVARKRLKILPSTMFWSGLEVWGIRQASGSQAQYHRSLDRIYRQSDQAIRNEDHEAVTGASRTWHAGLPAPAVGFGKELLPLTLSREEALYLQERIMVRCRGSLLAHLVDRCKSAMGADFVWKHPGLGGFRPEHRRQLEHARNFSETINGAALCYNLMLAEKKQADDLAGRYRDAMADWGRAMLARERELADWDRAEFWRTVVSKGAHIPSFTKTFIDQWFEHALTGKPGAVAESPAVRRLITTREGFLKKGLARLSNPQSLLQWRGSSGAGRLTYRWNPQVRQLAADIQYGLGRDA